MKFDVIPIDSYHSKNSIESDFNDENPRPNGPIGI